jgi:hypothetical protein
MLALSQLSSGEFSTESSSYGGWVKRPQRLWLFTVGTRAWNLSDCGNDSFTLFVQRFNRLL